MQILTNKFQSLHVAQHKYFAEKNRNRQPVPKLYSIAGKGKSWYVVCPDGKTVTKNMPYALALNSANIRNRKLMKTV